MLNVGFSEILLFGIIALIVLGPEKLPIAARTAGRWYAHIRRLISNVQRDIEQELQLAEMREHMQKELARIKSIEQEMQTQLNQMHENLADLNQTIHPDHAATNSGNIATHVTSEANAASVSFQAVDAKYRSPVAATYSGNHQSAVKKRHYLPCKKDNRKDTNATIDGTAAHAEATTDRAPELKP